MKPEFIPVVFPDPSESLLELAGAKVDASADPLSWPDVGIPAVSEPSEISPAVDLSSQHVESISGQDGRNDDLATSAPDVVHQMANGAPEAPVPEDSGMLTGSLSPAAASSVPALEVSASPMGGSSELHFAELGSGYDGTAAAPGAAATHSAGVTAATADLAAMPAPAALADPAETAIASSGPITEAAVGSGGATAAQVQQALDESGLSVNGTGIKVGVLSDSFNDLGGAAADEVDGALPSASNIDVIKDLASGGADEGRAMMEIIHDIAPGASLAFYTAFESEQDFANGILALAAAGAKVIVDDVSYSDEPFFQNGVVAQAIQTVEAEGVTYVSAAGNDAANGYQASWTPISGTFDGRALTDAESFGGSLVQTVTINTEGTGEDVPLLLEWNQAYGAATSDLEILVFHNGTLIGTATNRTDGESTNPWVEFDFSASGTYQVAIENLSGPNPGLIKEITEGNGLPATISGANSGTVFGHAMTPGVIAAGAVSAADTPAFGFNPPASESFSSSGAGTELLFANNGTALSSPDVLNPVAVSGVDDIATTVPGGLSDFYGTSAASASLAGVAALILSADPSLTPAQVEQIMEQTALPMSNSAVSGAGLVQVNPAVAEAESFVTSVIQTDTSSFGSTSLTKVANQFFLYNSSGAGPELRLNGTPVVAGQFGNWTPIGAVQTASGYDVAWKSASLGLYTYWTTDSTGNHLTDSAPMSGNSSALESLETVFNQDLNGDGVIGPPVITKTVIQMDTGSFGSTSLAEGSDQFFYLDNSGGSGPELQLNGAPVVAGQFDAWTPIGAVQTAGGYDLAWKNASLGLYTYWSTDSSGNHLTDSAPMSATSFALESLETVFNQDLNGDGVIGPTKTVIQTDGSTSLVEVASQFYALDNSSGVGPTLQLNGAPVAVGQFGAWTPIGAVQAAGGYDVAWKNASLGLFTYWTTDSGGNHLTESAPMSATSLALESLETVFNQDLNGDGVIGPPAITKTVIQTDGSTSLAEGSNQFYFLDDSSGVGPELQLNGAPVMAGQFGAWTPIGAAQTAGGYDIAWKNASLGLFTYWTTDSSGNRLTDSAPMSATSLALESLETVFNQDLNGDGVIGPTKTVIQTDGSTSLVEVASQFYALNNSSGVGPTLQLGGTPVAVGQFGAWAPIGAVQMAGGYEVAWSLPGANQYSIWTTDSSGNLVSQVSGLTGTSYALEAAESVFGQDLNADGVIGLAVDSGGVLNISTASAVNVTFVNNSGATGKLLLTDAKDFTGTIVGFTGNGQSGTTVYDPPVASVLSGNNDTFVFKAVPGHDAIQQPVEGNDTFVFGPSAGMSLVANAGRSGVEQHNAPIIDDHHPGFLRNAEDDAQMPSQSPTVGHFTQVAHDNHENAAALHFHLIDLHVSHFILG